MHLLMSLEKSSRCSNFQGFIGLMLRDGRVVQCALAWCMQQLLLPQSYGLH